MGGSSSSAARRGRPQAPLDPAWPPHRRALAQRLRDLREACGEPPYRVLSRLAHCGSGSLSEAASARRLPTWETTRAYVSGCLRYAGREADVPAELVRWHEWWISAAEQERCAGPAPEPVPAPPTGIAAMPPPAPDRRRRRVLAVAVLAMSLAAVVLIRTDAAPPPSPMTGLFNVVAVPFDGGDIAPAFPDALFGRLADWARGSSTTRVRGPGRIAPMAARADREAALARIAARHGADVVVTGEVRADGDRVTVVVDIFAGARTLEGIPEFAGRHVVSRTEPGDVFRRNLAVHEKLADAALRHLDALTAFVRGLGDYALDDYTAAEKEFVRAERLWRDAGTPPAALHLMLGNTVGRAGVHRAGEAAGWFRRALRAAPAYGRAELGLAEALRVTATCEPGDDRQRDILREALDRYGTVLAARWTDRDARVTAHMKARLGLGLTHQCLILAGLADRGPAADEHFRQVLSLQAAVPAGGAPRRHGLRLAAEAYAGLALNAFLEGDHRTAARDYEAALRSLRAVDAVRPSNVERELVFLRQLWSAYRAAGEEERMRDAERRTAQALQRLAAAR